VELVPLNAGLPVAALACVATAVIGVALLGRTAFRSGTALRAAYHRICLGIAIGVLGFSCTALLADGGARVDSPARLMPAAVGLVLGTALLVLGLLRLPAVAADRAAALRLALDGALLAGCVVLVVWTLALQPLIEAAGIPWQNPQTVLLGVPLLVALGATGIAVVAIGRGRRVVALLAMAIAAAALTGLGLLLALWYGSGTWALGLGCGYALCLLLTALAVRGDPRLAEPEHGLPGTGFVLALVPAAAAIGAIVARVVWQGKVDPASAYVIAAIGVLVTARQLVAGHAAHRYARRLAEREAYFKEMAFTDALTGLGNRRRLMRVLYDEAFYGPPSVLLAIDLDGFKNVNDVRGHDVGDSVLVEVGRRLRANLRPGDVAARLGGDEFAVLTWAGPDEAYGVAQRLLHVLCEGYDVDGTTVFLSASIGLAGEGSVTDVPRLLRNADLSLRFAKQRGKNRVERYDAAYDRWMRRRTELEQELRGAIEREELSLVYQPVVALPEERPVGVEALLRWHHPTLGAVPPSEFVPVAEEFGLIGRIDRWVLHQACHQLSRWTADGHDPWLSVNISVRELHLPEYVGQLVEVLRAHRVPAGRLVLEVTEHAVAIDLPEVVERLAELRGHGVRIALDHFGAGYSSLGQLRNLPVDLIKIDEGLVDEPLVDAVVALGKRLGLDVVAEGVGTEAQRDLVAAAGCRFVQGDVTGAPMPAEYVEALLARPVFVPSPRPAQDLGQVDSGHEMRQS
jgi:diguanylate cyclase (GGDEF)-like protein